MEGIPLDVLRLDQNLALQASCLYFLLFRCSGNLLRVNFKMTLNSLLRVMAMVFLISLPPPCSQVWLCVSVSTWHRGLRTEAHKGQRAGADCRVPTLHGPLLCGALMGASW